MARIRYLKPDFFKDEDLATLPYETRLFFAGLWGLADKAGRLEDRPLRLKAEIFPYDDVDIEKCLQQLSKPKSGSGQPFINRYLTDKQLYIQIINWNKHQKPHHTEAESKIPPAPPLMEKGMEKGKEKQLNPSAPLSNGEITVIQPLRAAPFNPPSLLEVSEYAKSINFQLDAQQFIDFYTAKGWMIGKNKMKDWRAAVRTWKQRQPPHQETIAEKINRVFLEKEGKL